MFPIELGVWGNIVWVVFWSGQKRKRMGEREMIIKEKMLKAANLTLNALNCCMDTVLCQLRAGIAFKDNAGRKKNA